MGRKRVVADLEGSDESPVKTKTEVKRKKTNTISSLFLTASQPQSSQEAPSSQPQVGGLSLYRLLERSPKPVSTAASAVQVPPCTASWVDKYHPKDEEALVVHGKKVQELKSWLECKLQRCVRERSVLVISGPPGSGKSCTMHVIASELGCEVVEWNAPVPNMWAEHLYARSAGNEYLSKLTEFEMFALRAKFPSLSLSKTGSLPHQPNLSQPSMSSQQDRECGNARLLLIDDLPYIADAGHRRRLVGMLQNLASTARSPVVIITTEIPSDGGGSSAGQRCEGGWQKGMHKEVVAGLEAVQATFMTFNPITTANISKMLTRVASGEGLALSPDLIKAIAEQSGGDLRNAIHNLQLVASGNQFKASTTTAASRGKARGRQPKRATLGYMPDSATNTIKNILHMERDQGLGLFHALGKILYNKRNPEAAAKPAAMQEDSFHIQKKFCAVLPPSLAVMHGDAASSLSGRFLQRLRADSLVAGKAKPCRGRKLAAMHCDADTQLAQASHRADVGSHDEVVDLASSDLEGPTTQSSFAGQIATGVPYDKQMGSKAEIEGTADDGVVNSAAGCDLRSERHTNRPTLTQDPEQILQRSGLDATAVSMFLHENYLEFLSDEAMEDAACCSAYLSDAGFMSCFRSIHVGSCSYWGDDEAGVACLVDSAAGSVAARGLLWGNAALAKRRWLPLRASQSLKAEQARAGNRASIQQSLVAGNAVAWDKLFGVLAPTSAAAGYAAEVLPVLRSLSQWDSRSWIRSHLPPSWLLVKHGTIVQQSINFAVQQQVAHEDLDYAEVEDKIEESDNE